MLKRTLFVALGFGLLFSPVLGCDESNENGSRSEDVQKALSIQSVRSSKAYARSSLSDEALSAFVKGQYDFNFSLLARTDSDNAMISALSIQSALGMLYAGAEGETAKEMREALQFGDDVHAALNRISSTILAAKLDAIDEVDEANGVHVVRDDVDIAINNDIYVSPTYTWQSSWLDTLSIHYDNGITEMNFSANPESARKYINDVVSQDTHGRIQSLIPEGGITDWTQLVLTNAIYFKAPWAEEMHSIPSVTSFTKRDGASVDADYIGLTSHFRYERGDHYQAVIVGLRGDFAMMMVMPDEGEYDSVVSDMDGGFIDDVFENMNSRRVHLRIPEFSFETSINLKTMLRDLGMKKAFEGGEADFSLVTEEENRLYLSDIYHKSFVGVDVNGIEAAAATAVVVGDTAVWQLEDPITLNLDHPFIFVVYETSTRSPMFVGRLLEPSK